MTTNTKFVEMYKQAEERSVVCVGGRFGSGGKAFLQADRASLIGEMWQLGLTVNQAGYILQKELGGSSQGIHTARLRVFENQVNKGVLRLGSKPTGEHVGKADDSEVTFDGRIKTLNDVQPAFNRAARQLIKVGITNPQDAIKYVTNAFETARVEQKIDLVAERLHREIQTQGLSREVAVAVLERTKKFY